MSIKNIYKKNLNLEILDLVFQIIFYLCCVIYINIGVIETRISGLKVLLSIYILYIFGENYIKYLKQKRVIFYIVFLITYVLFNCGRLIADILGYKSISYADYFANYIFSLDTQQYMLFSNLTALFFINLGAQFNFIFKKTKVENQSKIEQDIYFFKIGQIFFIVGFIFGVIRKIKEVILIKKIGYLAVYTTDIKMEIGLNLFEKSSTIFLIIGFSFLLFSNINIKRFKIYSILYLIYLFIDSLKGGRGYLIKSILIFVSLYAYFYKKISIKIYLFLGFSLMYFSNKIINIRTKSIGSKILSEEISYFFYSQGTTSLLIGYLKDFREKISSSNYLLGPILEFINSKLYPEIYLKGQSSIEFFNLVPTLSSELSLILNKELSLQGNGLGGSFVAEILYYPYLVQIILFILVGYLINYIVYICLNKKYGKLYIFSYLNYLYWVSRYNLLAIGYNEILRLTIFFIIFKIIRQLLNKRRVNYN
ncbi:O-antigen polysaccharide polymerase Wzy [Cetobacterium sp. 8H]|uniref:O-antigen polysaccharide polymerase Wzy n=1 Tax=Cetobacterium sp. 8H TaxID=2759681 RepID=UPI00163C7CC3|nr:O-antigen polysaccharide polymerase Wzy [Cetobacterium sp. 8H]